MKQENKAGRKATKATLVKEVKKFLKSFDDTGTIVYTDIEEAKKYIEYIGDEAVMVLAYDGGGMYSVMNAEYGFSQMERFITLLEELGYMFEKNYSWACTIYPA